MTLFYMPDFMGDNGVHLMWLQKIQKGASHQNIPEPLYQPHDTGSNDPAFKNRPVENIPVSHIYRFTEVLDTGTVHTLFQRSATPEFLDQQRPFLVYGNRSNPGQLDWKEFSQKKEAFRVFPFL